MNTYEIIFSHVKLEENAFMILILWDSSWLELEEEIGKEKTLWKDENVAFTGLLLVIFYKYTLKYRYFVSFRIP